MGRGGDHQRTERNLAASRAETVSGRGAARLRTVCDRAPPGSRTPSEGSKFVKLLSENLHAKL